MSKYLRKSYSKGDVLLSEKPFAFALKGSLNTERCDYCFKRTELQKCSGCEFAYYCDKNCQRNAWTYHKYECANIKKVAPRVVPDAARLLARILIKLHTGGAQKKSYYSETKFRVFDDLMSHYKEIKKDERRIEHFVSLKAVLQDFLDEKLIPNEAELLAIYGRMVINTFNILDPELKSIGTGIYLAASIIDHSCAPNAVPIFNGTTIHLRTLEDIQKLDWLKVYISYIELLELPSVRQKELETNYYFLCQCKRCLDVEQLGCMTSTICQNKDCSSCIKGGLLETTFQCSDCNEIISQETKDELKDVVKFTEEQLQGMDNIAYLDICRVCLKKQKHLLHPLNIYHVKVLHSAFDSCIGLENWEGALDYGKLLLEPYLRYYGELHPSRGILFIMLGKISLYLNRIEEAKVFLKEAGSVLGITHGNDNVLVREELLSYMRQCLLEKHC